jgi:ABC-type branched-subunit amino acid transport system ATPase component
MMSARGALLDEAGLDGQAERHAGEMPYGRKHAPEIAAKLARDPQMLLRFRLWP